MDRLLDFLFTLMDHWGYLILLIASFFEATPIFGWFIPGQTIMVIAGFFAKFGTLDLFVVIFIAFIGAILGDLFGYILGKRYGHQFLTRYGKYFFFKESMYQKAKDLMHGHTGKTLILGRFAPGTRAFGPFIAGSTHVPGIQFLFYNIIGAMIWVTTFALVGYVFGKSYEVAAAYIGRFIFVAVVLGTLFFFGYHFINKKWHIFTKYHFEALLLNVLSLAVFAKMLDDVFDQGFFYRIDLWVSQHISTLWEPTLNTAMTLLSTVASPLVLTLLSVLLFLILLFKKKWYYSLLIFLTMASGVIAQVSIKMLVQRPRPEMGLIEGAGYSFPSGHSVMALIFFCIFYYAFREDMRKRWLKNAFFVFIIIMIGVIGLSRVYLNVHWLSDVIAGFAEGVFVVTFAFVVLKALRTLLEEKITIFLEERMHLRMFVILAKKLKSDPRIPRISKILLAGAIGYFFLPIDLIPDFIPLLGQVDDLIIIPSLIFLAILFIPREVFKEYYLELFPPR